MKHRLFLLCVLVAVSFGKIYGQFNADRVLLMGRNALYYEDYVLSIQRFNMVINAKPHLAEPYFYRGLAKFYLEDYMGADIDCSSAIKLNPYAENYYVLRGLCRIHLSHYKEAVQDYCKAIDINPLDANHWHNMVLCHLELKDYHKADSCLDIMVRRWPKVSDNYTMRAQVKLAEKDTVAAEQWVDRAIEVNDFDGSALSIKAMMLLSRNQYEEGEAVLDKAIIQRPRVAELYINRALARYNRDNLRGAMNDYDAALEINDNSYVGHLNRGLLRAQVGDDNHAIEDFNYVIERQPKNYIAIYNRAILLDNVGDYRNALNDLTTILTEYPEFWDGYLIRARIRRKLGDTYGAERDEFRVLKARMERPTKKKSVRKTRRVEEDDIEDYDKVVVEDSQEPVKEYASAYRGRVQDQQTMLIPLPAYILSYYERSASVNRYMPYWLLVDELNNTHALLATLHLTNNETTAPETTLNRLFEEINAVSATLEKHPNAASSLLRRALAYYHVRDFESGINDVDSLLRQSPKHELALFLRAQLRQALLMANTPNLQSLVSGNQLPSTEVLIAFKQVKSDLEAVVECNGNNQYAHYNMGNVHLLLHDYDYAIASYTRALEIDPSMPDAYYNRGIAELLSNQTDRGLADLSQAGELGLYSAYSLIKKYSKK